MKGRSGFLLAFGVALLGLLGMILATAVAPWALSRAQGSRIRRDAEAARLLRAGLDRAREGWDGSRGPWREAHESGMLGFFPGGSGSLVIQAGDRVTGRFAPSGGPPAALAAVIHRIPGTGSSARLDLDLFRAPPGTAPERLEELQDRLRERRRRSREFWQGPGGSRRWKAFLAGALGGTLAPGDRERLEREGPGEDALEPLVTAPGGASNSGESGGTKVQEGKERS